MFTAISQSITTELQSGKSDKRLWKMYGSESQSELLYVCWLEGGTCKLISNHSDLFFGSGIIDLFLIFFSSMWTDYVTKWFKNITICRHTNLRCKQSSTDHLHTWLIRKRYEVKLVLAFFYYYYMSMYTSMNNTALYKSVLNNKQYKLSKW